MPKTDIHPQYFKEATITCTCGATHAMGSTKEGLRLDICSNCHPFYSGNQKLIDTAGRVDRFREKMAAAQTMKKPEPKKEEVKAEAPKVEEKTEEIVEEEVEVPADETETEVETESNEEVTEEAPADETPAEEVTEEQEAE